MIMADFEGKVPSEMKQLLKLPGVARKTANVVSAHAFGNIQGVTVDTHVKRLSNRWKLTKSDNPIQIEKDLMALLLFNSDYLSWSSSMQIAQTSL